MKSRISNQLRLVVLSIGLSLGTFAPSAQAFDLFGCFRLPNLGFGGLPQVMTDWNKVSAEEFSNSGVFPSGTMIVPQGSQLNVVTDVSCLLDPARGPRQLNFLRDIREKLTLPARGSQIRSLSWKLEEAWDFEQLANAIESEPCIHMVSPEARFEVSSVRVFNDPNLDEQGHLKKIHFFEALPEFILPMNIRPKVTIAIIDTGVDFEHPDLAFNRWTNRDEIPGNGIDDDGNGYVDDAHGFNFSMQISDESPQGGWSDFDHGTHVAGLAAARFDNAIGGTGVAGLAKIMSLAVFDGSGGSNNSAIENAVRYAADNGADVINMSIGSRQPSRTMRSALEYAIAKGALIVAAAGNRVGGGAELCELPIHPGFNLPAVYASTLNGMMAVSSVDASSGRLSSFSNYSSRLVEISAPGTIKSFGGDVRLLSTAPSNSYAMKRGTSMAAPLVSGAAALAITWLRAYSYPSSPAILERILRESSIIDTQLDTVVQGGRTLDLATMVTYLRTHNPPRSRSPQLDLPL